MSGGRIFNGVDARTGRYLRVPETEEEFARWVRDKPLNPAQLLQYKWWINRYPPDDPKHVPAWDIDPLRLDSAGWGVILAPSISSAVQHALQPLLKHREEAAGQHFRTYRVAPDPTKEGFLAGKAGPGAANPKNGKAPYYLLIVGSPKEVSFRFQYQLDVQYAVGRIHFTDKDGKEDIKAYEAYAQNVVNSEKAAGRAELPPKQIALFGVSRPGDTATERSQHELIQPLAKILEEDCPDWPLQYFVGPHATKQQLARLLGGGETPSILLTASHGIRDDLHLSNQGALLCQDWPGEGHPVLPEHYFSGLDLSDQADLRGLISFHFACYSGGTPDVSSFVDQETGLPQPLTPVPFVSNLAQRFLGHPRGALAFVGHVDRAWSTSFSWSDRGQVDVFENTLKALLDGHPIGSAMEFFNQRYAELAVEYAELRKDMDSLFDVDEAQFARVYRANNDVRNFLVLGDPAVKAVFRG